MSGFALKPWIKRLSGSTAHLWRRGRFWTGWEDEVLYWGDTPAGSGCTHLERERDRQNVRKVMTNRELWVFVCLGMWDWGERPWEQACLNEWVRERERESGLIKKDSYCSPSLKWLTSEDKQRDSARYEAREWKSWGKMEGDKTDWGR